MLKIDYDYKNNLPIANDCSASIDSPSIDICITDDENKNLTPAAKRLLE